MTIWIEVDADGDGEPDAKITLKMKAAMAAIMGTVIAVLTSTGL